MAAQLGRFAAGDQAVVPALRGQRFSAVSWGHSQAFEEQGGMLARCFWASREAGACRPQETCMRILPC